MGAGLVGGLGRMICSSWTSGSLRGRVNGIYLLAFPGLFLALLYRLDILFSELYSDLNLESLSRKLKNLKFYSALPSTILTSAGNSRDSA